MKLAQFEQALQAHIQGQREPSESPVDATESARQHAYREMSVDAWRGYLRASLRRARQEVLDEALRCELPESDRAWLAREGTR